MDFLFVQLRAIKTSCVPLSQMKVPGWTDTVLCILRTNSLRVTPPPLFFKISCCIWENFQDETNGTGLVCRAGETTHIPATEHKWKDKRKKAVCVWFETLNAVSNTRSILARLYTFQTHFEGGELNRNPELYRKQVPGMRHKQQPANCISHQGSSWCPPPRRLPHRGKVGAQNLQIKPPQAPILKG